MASPEGAIDGSQVRRWRIEGQAMSESNGVLSRRACLRYDDDDIVVRCLTSTSFVVPTTRFTSDEQTISRRARRLTTTAMVQRIRLVEDLCEWSTPKSIRQFEARSGASNRSKAGPNRKKSARCRTCAKSKAAGAESILACAANVWLVGFGKSPSREPNPMTHVAGWPPFLVYHLASVLSL